MLRIKTLLLALLLTFAVSFNGSANGDPVVRYSALTLSCTPQAVRVPEVKLIRESLAVKSYAKYAKVLVTYSLQNTSNKTLDRIDYGFPVDWYGSSGVCISYHDFETESEQEYGWKDSYVQDVHFRIDGNELVWACSKDTVLVSGLKKFSNYYSEDEGDADYAEDDLWQYVQRMMELYKDNPEDIAQFDLCRKWYYTSFGFEPGQIRTLTVEYTIATNYSVSLIEKGTIFKNNTSGLFLGQSEFEYDFSPSSYWGDGIVEDIYLSFDISEMLAIDPDYVSRRKSMWEHIWEPSFTSDFVMESDGYGRWKSSKHNYDLSEAKPLRISYYGISKEHEDISDLTLRTIPHEEYSVTVNGKNVDAICDGNVYTSARLQPDNEGMYHIYVDLNSRRKLMGVLLYLGDNSGLFAREKMPSDIIVTSRDRQSVLLNDYDRVSLIGKKPASMSYQDLTDSAEKYVLAIPSVHSYNRWEEFDYDRKNHLDIRVIPDGDKVPYLSEVVLLGEFQSETLFRENEVDTIPLFGERPESLWEYIENNFSMLSKLREDNSSYAITCEIDYCGKILRFVGKYEGHLWNDYIEKEMFESKLYDAVWRMIKSMPSWTPATIDGEPVGCIKSFVIK